ncbi:MAG: 3-oxoacyl-ACP synthase [Vicingus serpentipes]|nr:3-oxoacyl-ACP synthase [Vicingus serpentipes]
MKTLAIKIQLHKKCIEIINQRIIDLKNIIQEAQNAANNETKSSAGDKHETGRTMAQLETEKLTSQLSEALKLEQHITQINPKVQHQKVALGSLVITNNGNFYIAVSLGKIEIDGISYFAISTVSPIGKLLIGLKANDAFSFNGKNYVIERIK